MTATAFYTGCIFYAITFIFTLYYLFIRKSIAMNADRFKEFYDLAVAERIKAGTLEEWKSYVKGDTATQPPIKPPKQ